MVILVCPWVRNIPTQLGLMKSLQYLDVSDNQFIGNIPSELGLLSNLQYLDISYNYFVKGIPVQLGLLPQLTAFYHQSYNRIPSTFQPTIAPIIKPSTNGKILSTEAYIGIAIGIFVFVIGFSLI